MSDKIKLDYLYNGTSSITTKSLIDWLKHEISLREYHIKELRMEDPGGVDGADYQEEIKAEQHQVYAYNNLLKEIMS